MKRGGSSWNQAAGGKKGVKTRHKCSVCGRQYKMEGVKTTTKRFVNKSVNGGCEVIFLFVDDNPRDEIGRKLLGYNPIKLKNSTLFERDEYMNCEGAVPE